MMYPQITQITQKELFIRKDEQETKKPDTMLSCILKSV
jgi:hypothetical protein